MPGTKQVPDARYWLLAAARDANACRLPFKLLTQATWMRFPRNQRVTQRRDYLRIRDDGTRYDCGAFLCQIVPSKQNAPRLGIIATRKIGNAVVRNRAKRIFRELFRLNQKDIPQNIDIVIIVRKNFNHYTFPTLSRRLLGACAKWVKSNKLNEQ